MDRDDFLGSLKLASPCPVRWRSMRGDERIRVCRRCQRSVFNLDAMTVSAASELVAAHRANACDDFRLREDGTVVTADCRPARFHERAGAVLALFVPRSVGAIAATLFLLLAVALTFFGPEIRRSFGTPCDDSPAAAYVPYRSEPVRPSPRASEPPRLMYPLCRHDGIDHGPCTEVITQPGSWATAPLRRR